MTDADARELAEKHWEFLKPIIEKYEGVNYSILQLIEHLYKEAMIHGVKHEREF